MAASPRARDWALRRLTHLNRWLVAGSVALTGVLAEAAANAFPGRTLKTAHASGAARNGARRGASNPTHGTQGDAPSHLQPPAQAPQPSSSSSSEQSSQASEAGAAAPSTGAGEPERPAATTPSTGDAEPERSASPSAPAAEPERSAATPQQSAPATPEAEAPVVSGGS